ncbi:MAG: class I SAM-dependent RNA methyltransferase [Pseudotabrizicola sp.]|uniref:class I SAM-dependent RNA methyltransferase n=1 Tax=Pseudotabrizicola sp. TaxID=2939647 RepID=UPI002730AB8B|nr:class I SAM-dependent RNA methyltransferase [Pseudotabrizicola sp.]MDP2083362.1 class I SAM-dependent RNA methyltransferase [Pseudotabrizicola sp.]MDZ7574900.1 class I SAM-dependent RNA methyltransferase [Pseudotabrizicola sp.]
MIITIERLGHLGDGIAQGENGPIFVAGMLPGEVVEGDLEGDRLVNTKIVTPSAARIKPPCSHARACGGCLMQHASDDMVADWKTASVEGALAGQGLHAPFRPIMTSPPRSRRRATFAARRTKGGSMIGFHARGSDALVQIPNCQLVHPDLMAAMPGLEELVRLGGSRSQEVALMVTRALGGPDVVVTGGKPLDGPLRLELARVVEAHALARLTWDGETVALRATPIQTIGKAKVAPPAGAFLQATEHGERALLETVREALGPQKKIVDLFAGIGTFALPLAEGAEVHAVEGDPAMVAALDKASRNTEGLKPIKAEARDLFRRPLEPDEFKYVTGVVVDPPRAGAEAQMRCLAEAKVPVIAMVSCNPVTFARDAKILVQAGYLLEWIQVVDQFRWSAHVELVGRFVR